MRTTVLNIVLILLVLANIVIGASKDKPHSHQGLLEPYSGEPLPIQLTPDQRLKLEKGEPVMYNERDGKSGFGVVIQDIDATGAVCFEKMTDLKNYHNMVPHVKGVEVYEESTLKNGTNLTSAKFNVGLMGMRIGYYLKLRHEPKHNTLSWRLDYRYSSDIDDSVGLWQVMPHPEKKDWTRLLYSSKIKLLTGIPEFAIRSLTAKALPEATGWVKKEAELEQKRRRLAASSTTTTTSTSSEGSADTSSSTVPKEKSSGLFLTSWFRNIKGGCRSERNLATEPVEAAPKGRCCAWRHLPGFKKPFTSK